jgi:hypothetical protein
MLATTLFWFGCSSFACLSSEGGPHRLEFGHFPKVLGGCCEGELILDAVWSPLSEPAQTENAFEVGLPF